MLLGLLGSKTFPCSHGSLGKWQALGRSPPLPQHQLRRTVLYLPKLRSSRSSDTPAQTVTRIALALSVQCLQCLQHFRRNLTRINERLWYDSSICNVLAPQFPDHQPSIIMPLKVNRSFNALFPLCFRFVNTLIVHPPFSLLKKLGCLLVLYHYMLRSLFVVPFVHFSLQILRSFSSYYFPYGSVSFCVI